jgi:hypothetical protein
MSGGGGGSTGVGRHSPPLSNTPVEGLSSPMASNNNAATGFSLAANNSNGPSSPGLVILISNRMCRN